MTGTHEVLKLDEVFRPLDDRQWFLDASSGMKAEFSNDATLIGSHALTYHVLNVFETNRIPPFGLGTANDLRAVFDELRARQPMPIEVETTKVITKKGVIMLGLEAHEALVDERRLVLAAVERIFGKALPYSQHYNVHLGRVFSQDKERNIRHFLTDNYMPGVLTLRKVGASVTKSSGKPYLL